MLYEVITVPALWIDPREPGDERVRSTEAASFFLGGIDAVLAHEDLTPETQGNSGEWTRHAVVYNMFTRLTAAWDHDGNGRIELGDLPGGLRETGTFLKSITLLPYLKMMGVNTIHLLPVITSYSIHYTKLYDHDMAIGQNIPVLRQNDSGTGSLLDIVFVLLRDIEKPVRILFRLLRLGLHHDVNDLRIDAARDIAECIVEFGDARRWSKRSFCIEGNAGVCE